MDITLKWIFNAAYREAKIAEKTRLKWSNNLSIYSIDPIKLQVIQFNTGMKEHRWEIDSLRRELEIKINQNKRRI